MKIQQLFLFLCTVIFWIASAQAEYICNHNDIIVEDKHDNVEVPSGATCTLEGAIIYGNVIVKMDAEFQMLGGTVEGNLKLKKSKGLLVQGDDSSPSLISGNIQANRADFIALENFTAGDEKNVEVGGNLLLRRIEESIKLDDALIKGNVTIFKYKSTATLEMFGSKVLGTVMLLKGEGGQSNINDIKNNTIFGDLEVNNNSTLSPINIEANTINGDLICEENDTPRPCEKDNNVGGYKQCDSDNSQIQCL